MASAGEEKWQSYSFRNWSRSGCYLTQRWVQGGTLMKLVLGAGALVVFHTQFRSVSDMTTVVAWHEALPKAPCLRSDPLLWEMGEQFLPPIFFCVFCLFVNPSKSNHCTDLLHLYWVYSLSCLSLSFLKATIDLFYCLPRFALLKLG